MRGRAGMVREFSAPSMGKRRNGKRKWWRREGSPEKGFRYLGASGRELRSEAALRRIRSLAIPPAWTDVHIAPNGREKLQAWGRDAAGRKQYIYNEEFVDRQSRRKWQRVLRLARALPRLREVTNQHLRREQLDRQKVLATVVRLMSRAYFRVGSERYAVENQTFGICTLKKRHMDVQGNDLIFTYKGKRKIDQRIVVADTPLVEIIRELLELPGERLFQYPDDAGEVHPVTAAEVNAYISEVLGERYTSKDLRSFGGTVRAATILADLGPARSKTEAKKNLLLCCRFVATELGNTPAVCRSAYIHPAVLEEYQKAGRTAETTGGRPIVSSTEPVHYYPEEAALLRFLEKYG